MNIHLAEDRDYRSIRRGNRKSGGALAHRRSVVD